MNVEDVLKAISSGDYILELNVNNEAPTDTVIIGAVSQKTNPAGFGRREFAFRGVQQDELLIGLSEIINAR